MEMKTTLNSVSPKLWNPRGVFIAIREEGGQGTNPGPKRRARRGRMAAKTRPKPRFRGHQVTARAALRAARSLFCPLLGPVPSF